MKKKLRVAVLPGSEFPTFEDSLMEERVTRKIAEILVDRDGISAGRGRSDSVRFLLQGGGLADPGFTQEDERFTIFKRSKLHRALRSSPIFRWVAQKARIGQIDGAAFGDGFLATFDGPAWAIHCGNTIHDQLHGLVPA